ncbi:hypothetical protein FQZ97_645570 [compost metagenome]
MGTAEVALLVVEQALRLSTLPVAVKVEGLPLAGEVQVVALLQGQHVELETTFSHTAKDAAVVFASQHHQGKTGELAGTVVDVEAEQVVFQDQLRDIAAAETALGVNLLEHLVGLDQDMAGAAGGVEHLDGQRVDAVRGYGGQLGLHLGRLLGRLDVVRHLGLER